MGACGGEAASSPVWQWCLEPVYQSGATGPRDPRLSPSTVRSTRDRIVGSSAGPGGEGTSDAARLASARLVRGPQAGVANAPY